MPANRRSAGSTQATPASASRCAGVIDHNKPEALDPAVLGDILHCRSRSHTIVVLAMALADGLLIDADIAHRPALLAAAPTQNRSLHHAPSFILGNPGDAAGAGHCAALEDEVDDQGSMSSVKRCALPTRARGLAHAVGRTIDARHVRVQERLVLTRIRGASTRARPGRADTAAPAGTPGTASACPRHARPTGRRAHHSYPTPRG